MRPSDTATPVSPFRDAYLAVGACRVDRFRSRSWPGGISGLTIAGL